MLHRAPPCAGEDQSRIETRTGRIGTTQEERTNPSAPLPGWIGDCRQHEISVLCLDLASRDLRRETGRAYRRVGMELRPAPLKEDAAGERGRRVPGGYGRGARWRTAATGGERAPAARAGAAVRWLGWGVRPGLLEVVTVCLQVGLVGPIMGPWAYTTGLACLVRSNSLLSEKKKQNCCPINQRLIISKRNQRF